MRAAPWFGVLLLLAVATGVPAAAPPTVFVDELTWPELRDQVRAGRTTMIIPIGGTEQNGPHMVLGKHNARARALAGKIAQTLGNALVAPVLAYVPEGSIEPPTAHMRFPGTVTVPEAAFEQVIASAARSSVMPRPSTLVNTMRAVERPASAIQCKVVLTLDSSARSSC